MRKRRRDRGKELKGKNWEKGKKGMNEAE